MDISSIEHLLTGLTSAKDIGQAVQDMNGNVDVQAKVIELQLQILATINDAADAKLEWVRLIEENSNVKHELRQLKEEIQAKEAMNFERNDYWRKFGGGSEEPFCPNCLDGESHRAARMVVDHDYWYCAECGTSVRRGEKTLSLSSRDSGCGAGSSGAG